MIGQPCAPLQESLWFLQQLIPASGPAFNVTTATRLCGRVDVPALEHAVNKLADRHEALRTTLSAAEGRPRRIVAEPSTRRMTLEVIHCAEADLMATVHQVAMTVFDLERGPLWRAAFLRFAVDEAVMVLCMSHVVADGWSMGVLHSELGILYAGERFDRPGQLPDISYNFSAWVDQARRRAAERHEVDVSFWREELRDAPMTLQLPADHQRPAVETYAGGSHIVDIPVELAARITETARRLSATPFAVYLAGYGVALRAWSGERDLIIGTPFANRRSVKQEGVVGPLMEMLLLRLSIAEDTTGESLIRDIRRRTLRAIGHVDLGFEGLVANLQPTREAGRNPMFQTMFLMQNSPLAPIQLAGTASEAIEVKPPTARLDLTMDLTETNGQLTATLEYNSDLFEPPVIASLSERYLQLLGRLTAAPSQLVDTLDPILPAESQSLRHQYRGTVLDQGGPALLHELVDSAGRVAPEAIAIETAAETVTYGELARRSITAARGLNAAGVRPQDVVGVCLDRGVDQVVAVLAVLRTGAAYLPMDPDHPAGRRAEICSDANVTVMIADEQTTVGVRTLQLDELTSPEVLLSSLPAGQPFVPEVISADIAYVMYTSGSTGRPKGVMVSHRSAVNMISWAQRTLPMTGSDRMLGKTPYTFDISVWEIFGTLGAGATLVLADPGRHRDAGYVADMLADAGITLTHFVPSMLRGVLGLPRLRPWPRLRHVLAGGEALPAELCERLARHCPAPVYNIYGPTEATICASWHPAGHRITANGTVPIGLPVANTTMHVLDEELRPVPLGAYGELCLGGVQVAQGYLRRPGLTATRFLADPFADEPGSRMYRTGDIVRRASDGCLDFLTRRDGQVKLRGFRIELGEIEAALTAIDSVAAAAVEIRGEPGTEWLAAHIVPRQAPGPDAAELQGLLSRRLPAYMIPARFQIAAELPLTSSGKLDRNRLGLLPMQEAAEATGSGPRGALETLLADVWSEVLGTPVTAVDANFFGLGGDSITCVAVVAECDRRGLEIAVRDVFEHPTVAGLAQLARPRADTVATVIPANAALLVELTAGEAGRFGPLDAVLPLGPMQEYAVERVDRARLPGLYVVCFTAAIDEEGFDVAAWERTWHELMRRHECLRTSFLTRRQERVQLVHRDLELPFETIDLRHLGAQEALEAVQLAEANERLHVIDITDAPQWAMRVFRIDDDTYRVICRLSYLVQDGWSVSVLQNEWYPLYDAYRRQAEPTLRPAPEPFVTHLQHLAGRDQEGGRTYWRKRLDGVEAAGTVTSALRSRCRPGAGPEYQTVPRWLTADQETAIRSFARREGLALFAPLQGAWALLLAGITGRADVLFGTISSGRATADMRDTYGSFNNMMPTAVRLNLDMPTVLFLLELQARGADDRENDHIPLSVIAADKGIAAVDLLDTYIVHENFPVDPHTQSRFARWRPDIAEMRTEHALRILIWPVGELSLHLSFDGRILSEADASVLMDRYIAILLAMASSQGDRLFELVRNPWSVA